jgi:branched-chain amino acid transport system substrate-binding protein
VLAIVGPNASLGAIPASEIAEASQTLLITPWSTNPKTTLDNRTGLPKKYVFRACFTDPFQGQVLARFITEKLGAKTAGVLYDVASEAPKSQAELFRTTFEELGGSIVAFETYTTGDRDFSAQLTKIKSVNPDVVFLPAYYNDVGLIAQQARRQGIDQPLVGSGCLEQPRANQAFRRCCRRRLFRQPLRRRHRHAHGEEIHRCIPGEVRQSAGRRRGPDL